jgi:hypothetical protein
MQVFENQQVGKEECPVTLGPKEQHNAIRWTRNQSIQNLSFFNCEFIGESLVTYGAPVHRSTARNIRLKQCRVNSFFGTGAIFDDVVIDGLRVGNRGVVCLHGCAFRHVVLKGRCGAILLNRNIEYGNPERSAAFNAANAAFYEAVDWALDIRGVDATCLDIRGSIPARLILRNPETHVVMTRDIAESGDWKKYDGYEQVQTSVSIFLDSGSADTVLVPSRRRFKEEVEYFKRLRLAGIVT